MAEFERVVHDDTDREAAHEQLVEVMRTLWGSGSIRRPAGAYVCVL